MEKETVVPYRRIIFIFTLICSLIIGLSALASAQTPRPTPTGNETTRKQEVGKWLRIIKSPDPLYVMRGGDATFDVVVINTSGSFALTDVEVTDPLTPDCSQSIGNLLANETVSYKCSYRNVQTAFTNEIIVTGVNATNNKDDAASDTARVEVLELTADMEAQPDALPVPGGPVKLAVTVTNKSSTAVRLTALTSAKLGNLADPQNPLLQGNTCPTFGNLPTLQANGGTLTCSFTAEATGFQGNVTFDVTATAVAGSSSEVSGSGGTVVNLFEVIDAKLLAAEDKVALGGSVKLTATVNNLSTIRNVVITRLVDATLGDVDCELPRNLAPGESFSCSYQQTATGDVGETQSFILEVIGTTDDDPPLNAGDRASADITVIEPFIHLPLLFNIPKPNTCTTALPLETDELYEFYPFFRDTYYRFELASTATVSVEVRQFKPADAQIVVYKDLGGCSPATLEVVDFNIDDDPKTRETRILDEIGEQQAGNYYIRVFIASQLPGTQPYTLFIRTN